LYFFSLLSCCDDINYQFETSYLLVEALGFYQVYTEIF
jgi:hypothetical protein